MDKYHIDYWYENALEISKKYYWTTVGIVTRTESVESTVKRFAVYSLYLYKPSVIQDSISWTEWRDTLLTFIV